MTDQEKERGYFGRGHNLLRFDELGECFIGRIILGKISTNISTESIEVNLSLKDFFPDFKTDQELESHLEGVEFEYCNKLTEYTADCFGHFLGTKFNPATERLTAFEFYNTRIEQYLRYLRDGDEFDTLKPVIDAFESDVSSRLHVFKINVRPQYMIKALAESIRNMLELKGNLVETMSKYETFITARVDYRKQIEFLMKMLEQRQQITGEQKLSFSIYDFGFRHFLTAVDPKSDLFAPAPATTTVEDKVLLPLLLEVNGLLDILATNLTNDPRNHKNVDVNFFVARPSKRNIYGANSQGLTPELRAQLNESELVLFDRLHQILARGLVFGGRAKLECVYAEVSHFIIRQISYCLEEPSFLTLPARLWLANNKKMKNLRMEDDFFLPFIYERLRIKFGARIVKKPERFGGEIDILFDDMIPIELKVRKRKKAPLSNKDVDTTFKAASQAAAYASVSRLGIVLILDLPREKACITNIEQCCNVFMKNFSRANDLPTCIVTFIFHCHHPRPSSLP